VPNTNHFWTKDEESAVVSMDWADFSESYPDISYNAFRFKRKSIVEGPIGPARKPIPKAGGNARTFSGFTMGFFDIETTFSTQPRVLYAAIADAWGNVERFSRDQFPGEHPLYDDSELVNAIVEGCKKYDIIVTWNGKMFDVPVINGRQAYHGNINRLEPKFHLDLMYYARGQSMRIGRSSLESVSRYFDAPHAKTPLSVKTWDRAVAGDDKAYAEIATHCDADVLVLRDVFNSLKGSVAKLHR